MFTDQERHIVRVVLNQTRGRIEVVQRFMEIGEKIENDEALDVDEIGLLVQALDRFSGWTVSSLEAGRTLIANLQEQLS